MNIHDAINTVINLNRKTNYVGDELCKAEVLELQNKLEAVHDYNSKVAKKKRRVIE